MRSTICVLAAVLSAALLLPLGACSNGKTEGPDKAGSGKKTADGQPKDKGQQKDKGEKKAEKDKPERPPSETLTILCGGSFRVPAEALVAKYAEAGGSAELSFGQSEDHFPHVELQDAGDIFISHTPFMEKTKEAIFALKQVE